MPKLSEQSLIPSISADDYIYIVKNTGTVSYRVTQSAFESALTLTESQISDLQSYSLASHNHAGVYEPADATILKDADIGLNVQAHSAVLDATTASFLVADEAKLDGIAAGADVTAANETSHADVLVDADIGINVQAYSSILAATTAVFTLADETKLDGVAAGADVTSVNETSHADVLVDADIGLNVQAHSAVLDATTASFTTADETKLDAIEAGADVTDATNVTAAGALMDSEVDADIKTLALPANTTISVFGATLIDDISASAARSTLGLAIGTNVQAHSAVLDATTASFLVADESKLDGIEAGADVTDTTNVTAAGALMDSEVDADIKTLILPANTTISAFGKTLIDDANAAAARTTLDAGIVFQCSGSVSPADATTYYFGGHNFAIALADYSRIYIPRAGTIKRIDVNQLVTPTVGSSETSTISLRLNNTTDHTITSAFQQDLAGEVFTNSALSIAVVAGDYFEIKWLTPTWVTDPSIVYLSFTIYVE